MKYLAEGICFQENGQQTAECVLPVLEVGKQVSNAEHDYGYGGSYPKDFYEALIRPDWRQWVEAVKSENDSWLAFQASDVVDYTHVELGASVIRHPSR